MKFPFVECQEAFSSFCEEARRHGVVGVDTEFVWERTYFPQLGLIQIAWDREHCILADPLALKDPSPLKALLEDGGVTKVFHEAGSDLPILVRWCGNGVLPRNVVDTRIAAGFCGLTASLSLAKLILSQLGIDLPKTETRSDWLQRPLSDAQLEYGGDDACLLPELWAKLRLLVAQYGNLEFFLEEMHRYECAETYRELPVEEAVRRLSGLTAAGLDARGLALAKALACWRETECRMRDIPRSFLLRDEQILLLARIRPCTVEALQKLHAMPSRASIRDAVEIVRKIREFQAQKISAEAAPPVTDHRRLKQISNRILSLVEKRAEARGISPQLLGTRKDANRLAAALLAQKTQPEDHPLLGGWRHSLLSPALDELLRSV